MKKLLLSVIFAACSTTSFADQLCSGTLEDITIQGNVTITNTCKLARVKVDGNVVLSKNTTLTLLNSDIKGSVVTQGQFNTIEAINNQIEGQVHLQNGQNIRLVGNQIKGNIVVEKNLANIFIQNNRSSGNLKCQNNSMLPKGGQNYIAGDKEQQCLGL